MFDNGEYPTQPWTYVATSTSGTWSPPKGSGEIQSSRWGNCSELNRLTCGCVLFARIKMEQGAGRTKPGTNGRIYHLEAGDRIEMQFWLHVARNAQEITCKLGGGGTQEHTVTLDDCQPGCVQKSLFDTAPWLKFTLVADKPESDHDVGHVPLRADQLPGEAFRSSRESARECVSGFGLCHQVDGC